MTQKIEIQLIKTKVRQLINYVFYLEERHEISLDDWFSMINDLDNFIDLLDRKENNGR